MVLFHLALSYNLHNGWELADGFFMSGYAGVDLFFVISGFVIMHTSARHIGQTSYFSIYLRRRLIRLYPVYWVTLLLLLLGLTVLPLSGANAAALIPTSWSSLLRTLLLWPDHIMINGVTWSLSYELYYYLLFSLLILSGRLWPIPALVLVGSGVVALRGLMNLPDTSLPSFLFSPFNLEFALGVVAWQLVHRYRLGTGLCVGLAAVAVGWLVAYGPVPFEDQANRFFRYGFSSFALLVAVVGLEQNGWFGPSAMNRQWIRLGNASFLLYIIHFPILTMYAKLLSPYLHGSVDYWVATVFFVTVLWLVSVFLHERFEMPLLKKVTALLLPAPTQTSQPEPLPDAHPPRS